jgi:hypothetical protein
MTVSGILGRPVKPGDDGRGMRRVRSPINASDSIFKQQAVIASEAKQSSLL